MSLHSKRQQLAPRSGGNKTRNFKGLVESPFREAGVMERHCDDCRVGHRQFIEKCVRKPPREFEMMAKFEGVDQSVDRVIVGPRGHGPVKVRRLCLALTTNLRIPSGQGTNRTCVSKDGQ